MKSLILVFVAMFGSLSFAQMRPRPPIGRPPIANPGPDLGTLYCLTGGQMWFHMGVKVSEGKMSNGPMMVSFNKAAYAVEVNGATSNLQKGDCGFVGGKMTEVANVGNSFYDSNVVDKQFFISLDMVVESGHPAHTGETTYDARMTVLGYESMANKGVLFKVPVKMVNGTLEVEASQAPVVIK